MQTENKLIYRNDKKQYPARQLHVGKIYVKDMVQDRVTGECKYQKDHRPYADSGVEYDMALFLGDAVTDVHEHRDVADRIDDSEQS